MVWSASWSSLIVLLSISSSVAVEKWESPMALWSVAANDAQCGHRLQWWPRVFFSCPDVISHYNLARVIQKEAADQKRRGLAGTFGRSADGRLVAEDTMHAVRAYVMATRVDPTHGGAWSNLGMLVNTIQVGSVDYLRLLDLPGSTNESAVNTI